MDEVAALEMEDVQFAYDVAPVLDRVNLRIQPLDFVGIVGPNGGGKTTLLKLALGLLKPTRGTVRLFGERPEKQRRRVGYVPQSAGQRPQFPVTVLDVVRMGALGNGGRAGPGAQGGRNGAQEALERVGLAGWGRRRFAELSGGEQQRVIVARALSGGADVLMLDEPTTHVDAAVEADLYQLLRELNQAATIILVTHDLAFISRLVRTVVCVSRRVTTHPTCTLDEVTADVLRRMYGSDIQMVRHDQSCQEGEPCC